MDWNSATTKKHIKEAEAVGLTLIGEGRNYQHRTYRCNNCKHEQEKRTTRVRSNKIKCNQCFQIKLETEAKTVGITLVGKGRNASYRTYRFNDCKHEQEIATTSVRNNEFKCNQCLQIKLEEEAKANGMTLIGKGRNYRHRTYCFNDCKHQQEILTGHIRYGKPRCNQCLEIKHEAEAKAVGITLMGKGRNVSYRTYRFNDCKHQQEVQTSKVRVNGFECKQCLQMKYEAEAKAVGLILIGEGRNTSYRTYRFNDCKHEQEIALQHVRDNAFLCSTCEETSRDLPSKVYLLKIQSGSFIWLKLGYAKTVKTRISQYHLPEDIKLKRLKVIDFKTGREAHEFESKLHTKHKRKRLPVKKMKEFHKEGFNECYPLEMLDKLLEELESK